MQPDPSPPASADAPPPAPPPLPSSPGARAEGSSPHPAEPPIEHPSVLFLVVLTTLSAAADLATKWWAKAALSGYDHKRQAAKSFEVIKGHFDFVYTLNPGGAWSFLRGLPDTLRRPFFLFVSAAAIIFIISVYRRIDRHQKAMKWGLPLALGGAIGNLVDRIRYGSVIDFIDMYFTKGGREIHWPTYNVADIAIVVGVGLMALDTLITPLHGRKAKHSASDGTKDGGGGQGPVAMEATAGSAIEPSPPAV